MGFRADLNVVQEEKSRAPSRNQTTIPQSVIQILSIKLN